jgi:ABC-type transport system involved in cytochrome c biogenesis permease subunit
MPSQKTRTFAPSGTPFLGENPDTLRMTAARRQRSSVLYWVLFGNGLALGAAVIALGVYLFVFAPRSIAPPADRKIQVPFADKPELWQPFYSWVVQEDGRNKPFDTFCREAVRTITGYERFEGNDPVAVVVSWLMLFDTNTNKALDQAKKVGCDWENYPCILCDYHELREMVYRDHHGDKAELSEQERHGKYVEPWVLRYSQSLKRLLRGSAARVEEDAKAALSPLEVKAREVNKRLALYDRIRSGGQEGRERVRAPGAFGVVALDEHGPTWFSLRAVREFRKDPTIWMEMIQARRTDNPQLYANQPVQPPPSHLLYVVDEAFVSMRKAFQAGDADKFTAAAANFFSRVESASAGAYPGTTTTARELWFNRANPFRKAWVASLFAALLLLSSFTLANWTRCSRWLYAAGLLLYAVSLAWSAAGFWCRVTISGRPPVSNMYESVIWVAFMTAIFGLVLELIYRRGVIALAAALVSTLGLVLADQLPLTLKPDIQPLQAVLRSNYWLVIHVLTIVSSYAAFALAWGLGNINIGLMLFAPRRADLVKSLSHFSYKAIQVGVVLLAAGTLLGGFWAAESWGRFWGWDPKEVWALIALLCYVIPLHARYVGWVKDFGLAACSVICFASVVMAWYGVNFVLGAGLHSYGFGGGNDVWVYWGGLINIALVHYAALRYLYYQPAAQEA